MKPLALIVRAFVLTWALAGCAVDGSFVPNASVTHLGMREATPGRAAIMPGQSTKADVRAALGETLAIRFDSGYEVWVYRLPNTRTGEFVVLFAPSGHVAKTRIRPETRT